MVYASSPLRSPYRAAYALAAFLILCYAVAALGTWATVHQINPWYATLNKPRFNPPNWIFAPVWTLLYTVMAVAAWMVWCTRAPRSRSSRRAALTAAQDPKTADRATALVLFFIQLALNLLWTLVFFRSHRLLVAAVVILALWMAILATALFFWRVRPLAGTLMIPYFAWVTFATALNLALLRLN